MTRHVKRQPARANGPALAEGIREGTAQAEAELLEQVSDEKRAQVGLVAALAALTAAAPPPFRWHLCCMPCRRSGRRPGCRDCQNRTRATFGEPMPGEYQGGPVTWAPAEPGRGVA